MKKAFGIINILITIFIIAVIYALLHSNYTIIEDSSQIDAKKQQAEEMVDKVTKLREKNIQQNNEFISNFDE